MNLTIYREVLQSDFTLGRLYIENKQYCYTCEDADRKLETNPKGKVYGKTAIPRGKYRVIVSYSHRLQKPLPELLDVPGYSGVRIHGGNTAANTLGCVLVGRVRTADGVCKCADTVAGIIDMIEAAQERGEDVFMEVA